MKTWEIQVQAVRPFCAVFHVEAATKEEAKLRAVHILEGETSGSLGLEWEPFDEDPDLLQDARILGITECEDQGEEE